MSSVHLSDASSIAKRMLRESGQSMQELSLKLGKSRTFVAMAIRHARESKYGFRMQTFMYIAEACGYDFVVKRRQQEYSFRVATNEKRLSSNGSPMLYYNYVNRYRSTSEAIREMCTYNDVWTCRDISEKMGRSKPFLDTTCRNIDKGRDVSFSLFVEIAKATGWRIRLISDHDKIKVKPGAYEWET